MAEKTKKETPAVTDEEVIEVLVATTIVLKGLAKKLLLRTLVNEEPNLKKGGTANG